jgi:regulator of replication initiation timing
MDMQRRYENLLSENQRLISEIDRLRQQLTKPTDDTISVSKGEWEAMKSDADKWKKFNKNKIYPSYLDNQA